jgi:DNA mismatch repair protein MutS
MEKRSRSGEVEADARLSPAMAQYQKIKSKHPEEILLFHIGDFYETFGEDARTVSRELDIVLTSRSRDRGGNRIPLAGVPCHAVEGYIARLIEKGYRVAVCDQVEDSKNARGIVKREVVRVVTPGMVMEEALLPSPAARYLLAISGDQKAEQVGLAFLDITTGEFFVVVLPLEPVFSGVQDEIARYTPAEYLIPGDASPELVDLLSRNGLVVTRGREYLFSPEKGGDALCRHFGVTSLEGYGISHIPCAVQAAGAALLYAKETQRSDLTQVTTLSVRHSGDSCLLDAITLRNLEIVKGIRDRGRGSTLLSVLDRTATPMGSRLLRQWLCEPLVKVDAINVRLDAVEYFLHHAAVRMEVTRALQRCADIGRIAGRIAFGNAGPRDLKGLEHALSTIPQIRAILTCQSQDDLPAFIRDACGMLCDLNWVGEVIRVAIVDDPPAVVRNGGVIREGYSPELDALRGISTSGKDWILELQQQERERTGIKSLKVAYNSVFGYYIEVTRPNLPLVPPEYQRKQTTSTGERFTIPELKEKEAIISSADERQISLEQEVYRGLLDRLNGAVPAMQSIARGLSLLDVASALAGVAESGHYCRPVVDDSTHLLVREGRHPVVEEGMPGKYVPNDLDISSGRDQILVITGANMAGKSTYMRAAALVTIMAQAGSFVPAAYARIGVVDRVFTRVGAFDDLASGQSTFLVEMLELANILNNVTERSLVILDEIGRGTSTLDGLCIARAVLEYLHGKKSGGPRTLFATHFHDLVTVEGELGRVKNFHFAVKETGREVVFLRKIIPGATDKSYGIHVATLAGVPRRVTDRARELLEEQADTGCRAQGVRMKRYTQMLLPDMPEVESSSHPVMETLKNMNLDDMTPLSALSLLYDLQKRARDGGQ